MTDQEYQSIPVAVARAAVQASGELEGIEGPLFLPEVGAEWEPWFLKREGDESAHPVLAKVTVTRKGQKPREVVIAWDEYADQMDANPEWDAIRESKPMAVFGGEAERHAYRVVFADVLAAAFPPRVREDHRYGDADPHAEVTQAWEPARDWLAEVKAADAVKLNALYDEAREAGALVKVEGLQLAFTNRMLDLATAPKVVPLTVQPSPPKPRPQGQGNRRRRKPRPPLGDA